MFVHATVPVPPAFGLLQVVTLLHGVPEDVIKQQASVAEGIQAAAFATSTATPVGIVVYIDIFEEKCTLKLI